MEQEPKQRAAIGIRTPGPGDEERIALLSLQLGYPSSPEEIRSRLLPILSDPGHAVYLAEGPGGFVAGWVHVCLHRSVETDFRAEVAGLVVDSEWRGRGIGRLLMEQAEAWARAQGCRAVTLRSNVIRAEAHRFYENLGYRRLKTQHAFLKSLA